MRPAWRLPASSRPSAWCSKPQKERTVYELIAGAFIAFTYLMPAASHAIEHRVEQAANTFLCDHGLGPARSARR